MSQLEVTITKFEETASKKSQKGLEPSKDDRKEGTLKVLHAKVRRKL
jgi:hypothetical protein